jgi:colanic acid biosynthesis glycosyl transferase WcaI
VRILINGLNFAPELIGIGKYTADLAAYLAEKGYAVRVVTAPPYYPHWQVSQNYDWWRYRKESWRGIQVFRCPLWVPRETSGLKRILHLLSFASSSLPVMVSQLKWNPDLVFSVAPAFFSSPNALIVSRMAGVHSWLHIHDFEIDAAFTLGMLPANRMIHSISQRIERSILLKFDRVSTISQRMVERLLQKGVSQDRVRLLPNWTDTLMIYPLQDTKICKEEMGISENQFIVLYSGNMGRKQGLEVLIEAAENLISQSKITFVLCGDGAARKDLELRASDLPNVKFIPLQPIEKLNQLLNLADIHVLPQRMEAADLVMPSKLGGMLASGRSVIVTSPQGTEIERIMSQVGIVVPPENPDQLAKAIQSLVGDNVRRNRLGMLGRKFVQENWAKDKVLATFDEELQKVTR